MRINAWARTDVGNVRENNEDSHLVDIDNRLFIVADGVGGSSAGEVASSTLVEFIQTRAHRLAEFAARANPIHDREHRANVFEALTDAIQEINAEIYEVGKARDPMRPMATTCDVLLLTEQAAFIAHVGDSRVYLLRSGHIYRITEDHTFAEQLKREKVEDVDVIDRYKNVLTRSIGGRPQVDIDALFIDLRAGDRILMCSDGLTDYLSGSEILEHSERRCGERLLEVLIEEAKERGGADNITTLLVNVEDVEPDTIRDSTSFDTLKQVDMLGGIGLFKNLDVRDLLKIMRIVYEVSHEAGETVIEHGAEGRCLYIIAEGAVELIVDGTPVARLGAGQHFGEFALINEEPRSATARCLEETLLLAVPAARFREIVTEDPDVGNILLWNLLEAAAQHIRRMSGELAGANDT